MLHDIVKKMPETQITKILIGFFLFSICFFIYKRKKAIENGNKKEKYIANFFIILGTMLVVAITVLPWSEG